MTRWEALLRELGVSSHEFDLTMRQFDLSPSEWLKARLAVLGYEAKKELELNCLKPCCADYKDESDI